MTEHSFGCIADQEAMGLYDLSKAQVYQKPEEITEKLKQEAEDAVYGMGYDTYGSDGHSDFAVQDILVKFAEPREKQIQIDAEQIRALQKQNGELTDKNRELEAQIEKMKCCGNCKHFKFIGSNLEGYYTCIKDKENKGKYYRKCINHEYWEISK